MVDNRAYNGSLQHNPFNFQTFGIQGWRLLVNGEQVPSEAYHFGNAMSKGVIPEVGKPFLDLFTNTGNASPGSGALIDEAAFKGGSFIIARDLTPDG